ncbi:MAG TPA: ABC transporter permease [Bryobacteraceae bacterium]|nr:ABC transporter permease [Bryobacteraceae bacterium]
MVWHPSARRIYRALLLAYPAEFRQEYGEEMERLFAERLGAEPAAGLWLTVVADVAITAPHEHLHILAGDVRHGLRQLAKAPGFACAALAALALGVGAATTVFSLINAVLIRALPYGEAERLVYLWTPLPRYEALPRELGPSFADVLAWRAMSRSFTGITALRQRMFTLSDGGDPIRVGGAIVLGNFFQTLNAVPELGRAIDPADDRPGQERAAVISDALWRSRFNRDPGALGSTVQLGKSGYRIVGIMPAGFAYPHETDFPLAVATLKRTEIWIPAALTAQQWSNRMSTADAAIGRLRPGVSLRQAQSEMSAIEGHLDPLNLPEMRGMQSLLVPFIETATGPVRPLMRLLAGAVVLVLLIACGNVANLLMARAVGRVHEMGVRTALGAPRARLVRQLLTESMLLAAVGGGLGALMSFAILKALSRLNPGDIPRFDEVSIDGRVLLFALLISLGTGFVFGILPALAASRVKVSELLRQGGRGTVGGWPRARHALIVTNVALAGVLLAGAGLLIRSYLNVQGEDKGFAPSTLTMRLAVDRQSRSAQQIEALSRSVIESVAALPGVVAAGAINDLPLSHAESTSTFRVDGYPNRPNQTVALRQTAGDYFQAMQIRLIAGRFLNSADIPAQASVVPKAVVVSESFARMYFSGGNAIGGRLQRGEPGRAWSTIVGVVADVRHTNLEKAPQPTLYEPSWLADCPAIRTALPPDRVISSVRNVVHGIDPAVALADIQTMRQRTTEAASRRRFQTVVLTAFAGIAVFLALVGVYGLLSYAVRQRTTEIGVRMAMGAGPGALVGMVVWQGLMLTGAGLAIGLLAAGAAARWIASLLYGVHAFDAVTFIAVPVLMLMAAAVACFVPAWKAAHVDPVGALRQE